MLVIHLYLHVKTILNSIFGGYVDSCFFFQVVLVFQICPL